MAQIRINTEQTRDVGQRLLHESTEIEEIGRALRYAVDSLDTWAWDGHNRNQAETLLSQVSVQAASCVATLETLGRKLSGIADAFEQTDSAVAENVGPWSLPDSMVAWQTHPLLRIGSVVVSGGAAIGLTQLPVNSSASNFTLAEWAWAFPERVQSWFKPAIDQITKWLGWYKEAEPVKVIVPGKTWGEEPVELEPLKPRPKVSEEIEVELLPPRLLTPILAQRPRSSECAPTAASMILGYWNKVDSNNQNRTPQELIEEFGPLFDPNGGMNAEEVVQGLKQMDLGYETIEYKKSFDKEKLQTELENGPVMAVVRTNWAASGSNNGHMVTVTEISEDGQTVYVNDPWTGKAEEISWDTFAASWSWPGYEPHTNAIIAIRP